MTATSLGELTGPFPPRTTLPGAAHLQWDILQVKRRSSSPMVEQRGGGIQQAFILPFVERR